MNLLLLLQGHLFSIMYLLFCCWVSCSVLCTCNSCCWVSYSAICSCCCWVNCSVICTCCCSYRVSYSAIFTSCSAAESAVQYFLAAVASAESSVQHYVPAVESVVYHYVPAVAAAESAVQQWIPSSPISLDMPDPQGMVYILNIISLFLIKSKIKIT